MLTSADRCLALVASVLAAARAAARRRSRAHVRLRKPLATSAAGSAATARAPTCARSSTRSRATPASTAPTLERWLAAARFQPQIVALMQTAAASIRRSGSSTRRRSCRPERIAGGVAWWSANADALARAEERYGVPPEIIVAIVGVETFYGRVVGSYRVIDALSTLAFDYPRRAAFFRGELKRVPAAGARAGHVAARAEGLVRRRDGRAAVHAGQLSPLRGRLRRRRTRVDLWESSADVVGSVANYLARHDWQRGGPLLLPARIAPDKRDDGAAPARRRHRERRPLDGVGRRRRRAPALAPEPVDEPVGRPDARGAGRRERAATGSRARTST